MPDISVDDSTLETSLQILKMEAEVTSERWSEKHATITSSLQTLFPKWSELIGHVEDEAVLDEVILLLSYFMDCEAPNLFVHPISEIGQAQLDCAKVNFGGQAGDIPLVINVFRKFCATRKRERHHWCAQNCVDYSTVKKLERAYMDLKCSLEGRCGQRIIGSSKHTLGERLRTLSELLLKTRPEWLYIHDGRPGLNYRHVASLKHWSMSVDSTLSICPTPPKYVMLLPNNSRTGVLCSLTYDEIAVESAARGLPGFEMQLSEAKSKVVSCCKVAECGFGFQELLATNKSRRLKVLGEEVWKHCGCDEEEICVTVDPLTNCLLLYCPESAMEKAKTVLQERVKICKAECEAVIADVDYPDGSYLVSCMTSGGFLVENDSQPTYERTMVLWVDSPQDQRKAADHLLTEEHVKETLLKAVKGIVAVRKFRDFPESTMWGLVVMKDTMACKAAANDFNRTGAKYTLEWINTEVKEIILFFSVEKKVKNIAWVQFTSSADYEEAKKFPWSDYWVMEASFFDETKKAKFEFKRDRPDLYRLRNDISDLANVGVLDVRHESISPLQWPEEDLKFVENELESKFKAIDYLEKYEIEFLSRKEGDTQWKGLVRFESFHKFIPDKFHRDINSLPLKNGMVYANSGVREGITMKIPRRVYFLFKKEIQDHETDFHGSEGVRVSDVDSGRDIVSVHFLWWHGSGKCPDDLQHLQDLLKPTCVVGVDRAVGELLRTHHRPFRVMERWFQVAVLSADDASRMLLVYGKEESRVKAADYLKQLLTCERSADGPQYEIIPLSGPSVPGGLITLLVTKYGPTLDKLQVLAGGAVVHLDKQARLLLCRGSVSALETIKNELDNSCVELAGNAWKETFSRVFECVVCLTTIEDPKNPAFHLEICGHCYCTECLVSQVKTQISQKCLPISCVAEDCETKFSLDDILVACNKAKEGTEKLVEVALQHHLARNRNICRPCPTPDCPVMFHTAVDNDKKFQCPKCDKSTCVDCEEKWHPGLSCEIKKEIENLDDEKLKSWIQKKPKFRKMCPSCKSGVEKSGGCDNVHCSVCSTSMCWKCLAFFKQSGDCYDHISTKHRNDRVDFVDDEELMDYDDDEVL